jgi:hypothetical protein
MGQLGRMQELGKKEKNIKKTLNCVKELKIRILDGRLFKEREKCRMDRFYTTWLYN